MIVTHDIQEQGYGGESYHKYVIFSRTNVLGVVRSIGSVIWGTRIPLGLSHRETFVPKAFHDTLQFYATVTHPII